MRLWWDFQAPHCAIYPAVLFIPYQIRWTDNQNSSNCTAHGDCRTTSFCSEISACLPCTECHQNLDSIDGSCKRCANATFDASPDCNTCKAHTDCPTTLPFCFVGMCSICEDCVDCSDSIDYTCGPCKDARGETKSCENPPTPVPTVAPTAAPTLDGLVSDESEAVQGQSVASSRYMWHVLVGLAVSLLVVVAMRCLPKRNTKPKLLKDGQNKKKNHQADNTQAAASDNPFAASNYYIGAGSRHSFASAWEKDDEEAELRAGKDRKKTEKQGRHQPRKRSRKRESDTSVLNDGLRKASSGHFQRKLSQHHEFARKQSGQVITVITVITANYTTICLFYLPNYHVTRLDVSSMPILYAKCPAQPSKIPEIGIKMLQQ